MKTINLFRYRGYYYDTEIGLYYLNSRYYDPEIGRFINADYIAFVNPKMLNGLNLYAYCSSNPIRERDECGCGILAFIFAIVIAGVIAGGFSTVNYFLKNNDATLQGAIGEFALGFFGGTFIAITFAFDPFLGVFASGAVSLLTDVIHYGGDFNPLVSFTKGIISGMISFIVNEELLKLLNPILNYDVSFSLNAFSNTTFIEVINNFFNNIYEQVIEFLDKYLTNKKNWEGPSIYL